MEAEGSNMLLQVAREEGYWEVVRKQVGAGS